MNGLIVPVDITALCVGIKDQQDKEGTAKFAGATTSFLNQTGIHNAFLGSNVVRSLSDAPLDQLKKGIHLHWALPEALTRGNYDRDTKTTTFAKAPNRWLLSRITILKGVPSRKSWVIESDSLYDAGTIPSDAVVTLPVRTLSDKEQNYRYTGISSEFSASWKEPADPDKFRNLTGQDLSAVASGDVSFAAFYPNSRNIFGFYDDMSGLNGPIDVMYQLTGWFGKEANDPLSGGKTKADIETAWGWTFGDSDTTVAWSFYSGLTQSLSWNVNTSYIVDAPTKKPVPATVTVGNNPPETFSAYFKKLIHPDIPFFEELLNAFQTGLLPVFNEPAADQLAEMAELLHRKQFGPADAGHIHLIIQKPAEDNINNSDDDVPATDLPLQMEITLNLLNLYQQQYDFYLDYLKEFKAQLFSNWYRLMKAETIEIKNDLDAIIRDQINSYESDMKDELALLKSNLDTQKKLLDDQIVALNAERRLRPALEVKETPASRYWQPNEPVLLLSSAEFENTRRFNTGSGYLFCRIDNQLLQKVAVNKINISAAQFSSILLPAGNHLPHSELFNYLLQESCLLNTNLVSQLSGLTAAVLQQNLQIALNGGQQSTWTFTGRLPASIAVRWWNGNPWHPIMVIWESGFAPLQVTEQGKILQPYNQDFFLNNYATDQNKAGYISYKGPADPKEILKYNSQFYSGSAILSPTAADSFSKQLEEYLSDHTDQTLQNIYDDLQTGSYLSFAINGFGNKLLMRNQDLQLNIKVPEKNPYYFLTKNVAEIVGNFHSISPETNGHYNPVRAGYMDMKLMAVDVYGNKREIKITEQLCAASMTTEYQGLKEDGLVYLPPRLAQPARLIFRWLSATGDGTQEMNSHPATSPVCGWLLPNHLDESLFFYDQQGKALGNIFLNGNHSAVLWQAAPGDNKTINQTVEQVFAYQNPLLKDLAIALKHSSPAYFQSFWKAIDSMHNFVHPENYTQSNDLSVLIGRPVAVTQAMLRLELEGGPALNQSWEALEANDNNFSNVQFPVILGDLKRINDGLIGYFKQGGNNFDFSVFYSQAAEDKNGVLKPDAANLLLSASPKVAPADPADPLSDALKVLMLVDPRASVNATMGIMPVASIDIPPDQYTDTISTLEMTFLTTPVLEGVSGFNLPLPKEEGYQWSWVEQTLVNSNIVWEVDGDISFTGGQALSAYTPQTIREGWLRLNPQLLSFELLNPAGQPVAKPGSINSFTLTLRNKKPAPLTFTPGQLVPEGETNSGAVFYIHFGKLIPDQQIANVLIESKDWSFKCFNSIQYGSYWAATPLKAIICDPGKDITFNISKAMVATISGQAQVYFDYYDITGLNDGTDACLLNVVLL